MRTIALVRSWIALPILAAAGGACLTRCTHATPTNAARPGVSGAADPGATGPGATIDGMPSINAFPGPEFRERPRVAWRFTADGPLSPPLVHGELVLVPRRSGFDGLDSGNAPCARLARPLLRRGCARNDTRAGSVALAQPQPIIFNAARY